MKGRFFRLVLAGNDDHWDTGLATLWRTVEGVQGGVDGLAEETKGQFEEIPQP